MMHPLLLQKRSEKVTIFYTFVLVCFEMRWLALGKLTVTSLLHSRVIQRSRPVHTVSNTDIGIGTV